MDRAQLLQRLKRYKKRHARHIQIDLANQRAGRTTNQRTLDAIANNAWWIDYYTQLLNRDNPSFDFVKSRIEEAA